MLLIPKRGMCGLVTLYMWEDTNCELLCNMGTSSAYQIPSFLRVNAWSMTQNHLVPIGSYLYYFYLET